MHSEEQQKKDQIWKFVLEHQEFFCDPPPEGLGFPRPGMIPGHYLKRPEEWALDKIRVQKLKRERQLRDGTTDRTVSTGMAPGTRQLLDDIRQLAREGHTPADISAQLDVTEAGVRNVLALGQGAYDQGRPGTHPNTGARGIPDDLGQVLARRASQWKRKRTPEIAGCCLRSRSWAGRTRGCCFVCNSPAWPMHTVRPRGGDYGRYACFAHVSEVMVTWDDQEQDREKDQEVRGGEGR